MESPQPSARFRFVVTRRDFVTQRDEDQVGRLANQVYRFIEAEDLPTNRPELLLINSICDEGVNSIVPCPFRVNPNSSHIHQKSSAISPDRRCRSEWLSKSLSSAISLGRTVLPHGQGSLRPTRLTASPPVRGLSHSGIVVLSRNSCR